MTALEVEEKFVLASLIREVIETNPSPDPSVLAEEVVTRIPDEHLREALTQVMRQVIIRTIGQRRLDVEPSESLKHSSTVSGPKALSKKVQGIKKDFWKRRLNDRFLGAGGFVFLRDATWDDLMAAANERSAQAQQFLSRAAQFEAWAALLHQHNVAKFSDLPEDVQQEALT